MKRIATLLAIAITFTSFTAPAMADDDGFKDWRDRRQQIRDFFDCAFTPAAHFPGTIVDAAVATPQLSILKQLVIDAGLAEALSGPGPFTVYAPLDSAFKGIPENVGTALANAEAVPVILTYHVVPGKGRKTDPRRVFNNRVAEVKTLQGQSLFFSRDKEGTEINQSNLVSCQPVRTTNGIVYLIDSVMLPQFAPVEH